MRTRLAMAAAACSLAAFSFTAAPATATPDPLPSSDAAVSSSSDAGIMAIPPGCAAWMDYTDRGRAHINCGSQNVDVRVTVKCNNGKTYNSSPYWRYQYNRAECPVGIGAIAMSGDTR